MYSSSLVLLLLILVSIRVNKTFGYINASVFIIYTSIFIYGLYNLGQGGTALIWWFYLLLLTWLQSLIIGMYLIAKAIKK